MVTRASPQMLRISFSTLADFRATSIGEEVDHVMIQGMVFGRHPSGDLESDDGARWAPLGYGSPAAFDAPADGIADAIGELQAWVDFCVAKSGAAVGFLRPKLVLDFGGAIYGTSAPLVIPARTNVTGRDGHLIAIGNDWAEGQYILETAANWSIWEGMAIDCNKRANGIKETGARTRWYSPFVVRMSPEWESDGFYKPGPGGAGDVRIFGAWISQWITTDAEFADQANFTANLIRIVNSDCKIHSSNLNWGGCCYKAQSGVHNLYDCHLVQGRSGHENIDPVLIDYGSEAEGGELSIHKGYLDNGCCNFYWDKVNLDCSVLADDEDVTLTDGFLRFHGNSVSATTEPRVTGWITFLEWTAAPDLITFPDRDTYEWAQTHKDVASIISGQVSAGNGAPKRIKVEFANRLLSGSFNVTGPAETVITAGERAVSTYKSTTTTGASASHGIVDNKALLSSDDLLQLNTPGINMTVTSVEPSPAPNGTLAYSDGTWGGSGAGFYGRVAGSWVKL